MTPKELKQILQALVEHGVSELTLESTGARRIGGRAWGVMGTPRAKELTDRAHYTALVPGQNNAPYTSLRAPTTSEPHSCSIWLRYIVVEVTPRAITLVIVGH
ncbi:hypothetical protein CSW25_00470 [Thermus scotoductus]|uniref:Uncharacterized protein n=1 Tax=Thermus scotoductus TaxID=37636 RepID=A0ABY0AL39_THESC|nr:hypothetical protein CSW25_00470 [Thermus scotoductus]